MQSTLGIIEEDQGIGLITRIDGVCAQVLLTLMDVVDSVIDHGYDLCVNHIVRVVNQITHKVFLLFDRVVPGSAANIKSFMLMRRQLTHCCLSSL